MGYELEPLAKRLTAVVANEDPEEATQAFAITLAIFCARWQEGNGMVATGPGADMEFARIAERIVDLLQHEDSFLWSGGRN